MINNLILHEQMAEDWSWNTSKSSNGTYHYNDHSVSIEPNHGPWTESHFAPDDMRRKELLEELANTPVIKIPLWIEQHKKELKKLGIKIKKKDEK